MQRHSGPDEQVEQWIKFEHYRLHTVERWSGSNYKEAVLVAIRCTLKSLEAASSTKVEQPRCMVCASRRATAAVLELPSRPEITAAISRLAA
jgi:hypothetical protein